MTGENIVAEIDELVSSFYDGLYSLNEECINYNIEYTDYLTKTIYDASLLKEKMKDAIIKGSNHDI